MQFPNFGITGGGGRMNHGFFQKGPWALATYFYIIYSWVIIVSSIDENMGSKKKFENPPWACACVCVCVGRGEGIANSDSIN